jgi:AbrB family looped-hinge helix DNA binding protein
VRDTITIDGAGRVVIPKPLREALGITAGDSLQVSTSEQGLVLQPVRQKAPLIKELGVWVYNSGQPVEESLTDAIDRVREERSREFEG